MSFQHSIKVPRLYKTAAKYAQEVDEGASLKQLLYQKKHPNLKAVYALVALSLQWKKEIERLLNRSKILEKEPRLHLWLAKILLTELLWGKKKLGGESKPIQTILAYEQIFRAHLSDISRQLNNDLKESVFQKPRYARVNTIKLSVEDAVNLFIEEDWILCEHFDKKDYAGFLKKVVELENNNFLVDLHVSSLLIFPSKTEFYNHNIYKNGGIILQDKASCLPVHILNPPEGSTVLDMCAAPGMKTTHLAAVMNNKGKIYAVERDQARFETLNKMVQSSGASCVETVNEDILKCDQSMFPNVEYILIDPSCSGSGMLDRLDSHSNNDDSRLAKLAGFQIKILRRALTKFPNAKRVVYSTCSIHPQENEEVVKQVLETNYLFKLVPATKYLGDASWHNFGSQEYGNVGSYCLYSKPKDDYTNGFFVAVFEKLEPEESNEFFDPITFNNKKKVEDEKLRNNKESKRKFCSDNVSEKNGEQSSVQGKCSSKKKLKKSMKYEELQRHSQPEIDNKFEREECRNKPNENVYSEVEVIRNKGQLKRKQRENDSNKDSVKSSSVSSAKIDKKKKKKKSKCFDDLESNVVTEVNTILDSNSSVINKHNKKNKKSEYSKDVENRVDAEVNSIKIDKKKKKSKCFDNLESNVVSEVDTILDSNSSVTNKHNKKNKKSEYSEDVENRVDSEVNSISDGSILTKKRKKNNQHTESSECLEKNISNDYASSSDIFTTKKIKKKKKERTESFGSGENSEVQRLESGDHHSSGSLIKKKNDSNKN